MQQAKRDHNGFLPAIDVICQHTASGKTIPLRVKITDEDGEAKPYTIKQYKVLSTLDGVPLGTSTEAFECLIPVQDREKHIIICYNRSDGIWRLYGFSE